MQEESDLRNRYRGKHCCQQSSGSLCKALVNNVYQVQRAQLSNNANIITLGAQVTGIELAKCLVKEYLSVTFDPESRSMPKVARITEYEKEGK